MTADELREAVTPGSVIVLPLGAIEQHGPHLPVNTDSIIASGVANAGVERARVRAVVDR